jgi:hypothetical protein
MLFEQTQNNGGDGQAAVDELDRRMLAAARNGLRYDMLRYLEQGAHPNVMDEDGRTALMLVVTPGGVMTLLEGRADASTKSDGFSIMEHHERAGRDLHARIIRQHLRKAANLEIPLLDDWIPCFQATPSRPETPANREQNSSFTLSLKRLEQVPYEPYPDNAPQPY